MSDEEPYLDEAPPRRSIGTKVLAGILALLLVLTFAGSLLGGTRDRAGTTTTTAAGEGAATSTTTDRQALAEAGVALATALTAVPGGDVVDADDQNGPEARVVDVVAVGRHERGDDERFVFVQTRGGPPPDLAGCLQLAATYAAAGATAWHGEVNLGGPCASHGAFEKGRMAGFLLPRGALWVLDLDRVAGDGSVVAGIVSTRLLDGERTLADATAIPLDGPPVPAELAEALLALLDFRPANPPDGPVG